MRLELEELLRQKYPELFRDRRADMPATAMRCGFDCGDGWFDLVDVLCAAIQHRAAEKGLNVVAEHLREKYGQLRFSVFGDDKFVDGLIFVAGALSAGICEECGKPAFIAGQGWISTRCFEHRGPKLSEIIFQQDSKRVFKLPHIENPRWQRLAQVFEDVVDYDIRQNKMPMIFVDGVVEGESLSFRWHGGDKKGRAAAFFRLVEAYSERQRPAE